MNATKATCDGVTFASGLEKHMYQALKKEKLYEGYENEKFTLIDGFSLSNECYERQANGKGEFRERNAGKNVRGITYTPDFCGRDFIIECKGRANESFPIRWKLFKRLLKENNDTRTVYKPQTQKECERVVELIKNSRL